MKIIALIGLFVEFALPTLRRESKRSFISRIAEQSTASADCQPKLTRKKVRYKVHY